MWSYISNFVILQLGKELPIEVKAGHVGKWTLFIYKWDSVWQKAAYDSHDVILMRKEHYDVIAVYFAIFTKSRSFEQWKINVIEE